MKAFCFAAAGLILIAALVTVNASAILAVTDEMNELLLSLPSPAEAEADGFARARAVARELWDLWEAHENFVGLSVSYESVFAVESAALSLCAYAETADAPGYAASAASLAVSLRRLAEAETFSVHNLT